MAPTSSRPLAATKHWPSAARLRVVAAACVVVAADTGDWKSGFGAGGTAAEVAGWLTSAEGADAVFTGPFGAWVRWATAALEVTALADFLCSRAWRMQSSALACRSSAESRPTWLSTYTLQKRSAASLC